MTKKKVVIIGGGTAGLATACHLNPVKFDVSIFEKMPTLGRKFLVAGKGGFNLSHNSTGKKLKEVYFPTNFLNKSIDNFDPIAVRNWLKDLGIETFIGTSNRIFPLKKTKPIEVLEALKKKISLNRVDIHTNHHWVRSEANVVTFKAHDKIVKVDTNYVIYALGGGSWSKTGSDGMWLNSFRSMGIQCNNLESSNCGWVCAWDPIFLKKNEGRPLKNIAIHFGDIKTKGELLITKYGIEGGAIYKMQKQLRSSLRKNQTIEVYLDLKPQFLEEKILKKLSNAPNHPKINIKNKLIKLLNLSPEAHDLLKSTLTKSEFTDMRILSKKVKRLPLRLLAPRPLEEAISSIGGVQIDGLSPNFEIIGMQNHFCIGEMIDWDAPTGGYLIQGCFSMGYAVSSYLNALH